MERKANSSFEKLSWGIRPGCVGISRLSSTRLELQRFSSVVVSYVELVRSMSLFYLIDGFLPACEITQAKVKGPGIKEWCIWIRLRGQ